MKKIILIGIVLTILLTSIANALPVFPGAEGFGTDTVAGRGGTIYKVTTLTSSGPGSLRECVDASGPRICIFEVSGTIELYSDLNIFNPYITIAGQTAPSPGIQIKGAGFRIASSHDVLIQHLRIRPGDGITGPNPDWRRAMSMSGTETEPPHHVVIDHCSLQFGIDANANIYASNAHHITYSNNLITNPLDDSFASKGPHSKSLNINHNSNSGHRNISLIKNVLAHSYGRNPSIAGNTQVQLVNNVFYNLYNRAIQLTNAKGFGPHETSIVGNVHITGVNSRWAKDYVAHALSHVALGSRIYADDNMCNNYPGTCILDYTDNHITWLSSPEIWSPVAVIPTANNEARDYVLANAGARPVERDSVDPRVTQDVRDITGQIIDCVNPDPIYYPIGTARGGSSNTIIVEENPASSLTWGANFWIGHEIEITSGRGAGQIRNITAYNAGSQTVTVEPAWNTAPDTTSKYRRNMDCSNNAGGWPVLAENFRALTLPANYNGDDDGDGYTNLEELLHNFSAVVEGRAVEPPEPPPPEPIPGDLNNDTAVDVADLIIVAKNFGLTAGFQPVADTDSNGIVDIFDVVYVASRFT